MKLKANELRMNIEILNLYELEKENMFLFKCFLVQNLKCKRITFYFIYCVDLNKYQLEICFISFLPNSLSFLYENKTD
jgi:hypothetical protein